MRNKLMSLLIFFPFIISCADEKNTTSTTGDLASKEVVHKSNEDCPAHISKAKENNLNISILLDLSDRIEQEKTIEKDVAYLSSLAKAFTDHVKTKKLVMLEDRMQLFFNPEPSSGEINAIAESLKINFTKASPKELLQKTQDLYSAEPRKLYDQAQKDAGGISANYPGSDIWRFFEDNVRDYCIDPCHRNILVILTDGYMYYDKTLMDEGNRKSFLTPRVLTQLKLNNSNWENIMAEKDLGFIPATTELKDLEVLVIGINSLNDDNPYSQDIIEAFWNKWLLEMGIPEENFKIKNNAIASNMDMVITDFINR